MDMALKVKEALICRGLENPLCENNLSNTEKQIQIASHMQSIMQILGLDLNDDSLNKTPQRISKMFVHELFGGLDYNNFPEISLIDNKMQADEMVKVSDISFTSMCEHHFMVIDGMAKVAYMPHKKIIGLSKINRLVRFFAQRPQVQERLTQQILVALQVLLETQNVAVSISATHYCVKARGIKDFSSLTTTNALGGDFKHNLTLRSEFLAT